MSRIRLLAALSCVLLFVSAAPAQTKFTPQFPEGASYKTKESVKVKQSLTLGGQPLNTEASNVVVSQIEVGERNEQGELPIETTYTQVQSALKLPGDKTVTYDSTTGEAKADDPNFQIILDRLKALKGASYTVILDAENNVKEVTGLKPGTGTTADEVKVSMQQALDGFPEEAIQPGAEWEREVTIPLGEGQIFKLKRRYKYVGPEVRSTVDSTRRLEKVTATTEGIEYAIKPNSGIPGSVTKSDLKVESGETTVLFDPKLSRTVELLDKMHVTGKLTLSIMGVELDGDLDLNIETTSEEVK